MVAEFWSSLPNLGRNLASFRNSAHVIEATAAINDIFFDTANR